MNAAAGSDPPQLTITTAFPTTALPSEGLIGRLARGVVRALAPPTPPPIYRPAAMPCWTSPEDHDA